MFKSGSTQKVWWICKICGHSWDTDIYHRAKDHIGCPVCYRKNNKGGNHAGAKRFFNIQKIGN
jgi:rubrerythrin